MKKLVSISAFLLLVFGFTSLSFAQGTQTGSISGIVVDTDGSPLPGCTVTLSGPKHLGTSSFITNEEGKFRFPSLAPGGDYELKVELSGFQTTVRKGLIVNVAKNTSLTIEVGPKTLQEEVLVVAESPVVDVASSKMSINYSSQFVASIPMNRDMDDIQLSIPGAISEGASRRMASVLGGSVRSTVYQLDGAPMNDPSTLYAAANINVDIYEEVEIGLGAHEATQSNSDSAVINIVTKAGGNSFSGEGNVKYTNESLAENLISSTDLEAFGLNEPEKYVDYKDFSLNIGGPIIKDKIWFFTNGRRIIWERRNPYTPENRIRPIMEANPGLLDPRHLEHYDKSHGEWMAFGKLTFQLSSNIRLMLMGYYTEQSEPTSSLGSSTSWSYRREGPKHSNTLTGKMNWVLNQNTFADVQAHYLLSWYSFPAIKESWGQSSVYDRANSVYWGQYAYTNIYEKTRYMASAMITRFQDRFLGGSHEFKAGVEVEQTGSNKEQHRKDGNPWRVYWRDFNAGNPYYYSTSARQGRLGIWAAPAELGVRKEKNRVRRLSAFLQDSFTVGRLTLNVGFRFDHSYFYFPEQTRGDYIDTYTVPHPMVNPDVSSQELMRMLAADIREQTGFVSIFDEYTLRAMTTNTLTTLSPRLGAVYDLFGTGKTAVKLSFSRYFEPMWIDLYDAGNPNVGFGYTWYWWDDNANKLMDLPGVDRYRITSLMNIDPDTSNWVADFKAPYTNEFIVGVEHELVKNFNLSLQFISKQKKNIATPIEQNNGYDPNATDEKGLIWIPYTFTDPGWDQKLGTSDDQELTVYGLRSDRPVPENLNGNPPEAKQTYWGLILGFNKRMSNNWQLQGSILYSQHKANIGGDYYGSVASTVLFDNPTKLVNAFGRSRFDRPLQVKIMGSYIFPYDVVFSIYVQHRSGTPWGRTFDRVYFPSDYDVVSSYASVKAEPQGAQRQASYTSIDFRFEKGFRLGSFGELTLYVDIFNLGGQSGVNINQNPALQYRGDRTPVEWYPGPNYGNITSAYGIRSIQIGLKFRF